MRDSLMGGKEVHLQEVAEEENADFDFFAFKITVAIRVADGTNTAQKIAEAWPEDKQPASGADSLKNLLESKLTGTRQAGNYPLMLISRLAAISSTGTPAPSPTNMT